MAADILDVELQQLLTFGLKPGGVWFDLKTKFDQGDPTVGDGGLYLLQGQGGFTVQLQGLVQGVGQIRGGIGKGSIQIKQDNPASALLLVAFTHLLVWCS